MESGLELGLGFSRWTRGWPKLVENKGEERCNGKGPDRAEGGQANHGCVPGARFSSCSLFTGSAWIPWLWIWVCGDRREFVAVIPLALSCAKASQKAL